MKHTFQLHRIMLVFAGTLLLMAGCGRQDVQSQLDELLPSVQAYEYGENREHLTAIEDLVRASHTNPADRQYIEQQLIGVLESDATLAGKQFVCKQLSMIGTSASVPVLSDLVVEESTSDMARYALERIPAPEVDAALREAVQQTTGQVKVGIINSIGQREDAEAVELLASLLQDPNALIVESAASALGNIGTQAAAAALQDAMASTSGAAHGTVVDAYLECADHADQAGDATTASAMYQRVYLSNEPVTVRGVALIGIINTADEEAGEVILSVVQEGEPALQAIAAGMLSTVPTVENLQEIAGILPQLPDKVKVQVLTALGERGDPVVRQAVVDAVDHPALEVQVAALTALKSLGDASAVSLLAQHAASGPTEKREAARASLYRLRGSQVNQSILSGIADASPAVQVELIRSIEQRRISNATSTLFETATHPNPSVRLASIRVLGVMAPPEQLSDLLDLLINARSQDERSALERVVVSVANKIPERENRGDQILSRLSSVQDVSARASFMLVLGNIGDPDALPVLRESLTASDPQIRDAAIRALSEWPTPAPAAHLLQVAQTAEQQRPRVLALRGYIRLIGLPSDRSATETVQMYQKAMNLAENVSEQRAILSGLAELEALPAMQMAGKYLDQAALSQEAAAAVVEIAEAIHSEHPEETRTLLEKVVKITGSESIRSAAQDVLEDLQ